MDEYYSEFDSAGHPLGPPDEWREEHLPAQPVRKQGARVLIVDPDANAAKLTEDALIDLPIECAVVRSGEACMRLLDEETFDVAIVDADVDGGDGLDLVYAISTGVEHMCTIVTSADPDVDIAVDAMRCGAIDMIAKPVNPAELACRVECAIEQSRRRSSDSRRVQRLKRICKRLSEGQTPSEKRSEETDILCNDLADVYDDIAEQMQNLSVASEYRALIEQELDVESLLRTTLEFLLTRTGPTNAGVFLPTGQDDFNLGAYVNYDIPKDTADMVLDQLSDVVASRFVEEPEIIRFTSDDQLTQFFGPDAHWLYGSQALAMSCSADDECLAVVALFRENGDPFTDALVEELQAIRDLFADQLARVVRIHHRHLPLDKWPGFDVESDEDWGMAA